MENPAKDNYTIQDLNESDYKSFARISVNKDFIRWRTIIDRFHLARAMNLLSATPAEGVSEEDILKNFRGGYQLWKKATDLIDNADTMIAKTEPHDEKPIQLLGEEVEIVEEESGDDIS